MGNREQFSRTQTPQQRSPGLTRQSIRVTTVRRRFFNRKYCFHCSVAAQLAGHSDQQQPSDHEEDSVPNCHAETGQSIKKSRHMFRWVLALATVTLGIGQTPPQSPLRDVSLLTAVLHDRPVALWLSDHIVSDNATRQSYIPSIGFDPAVRSRGGGGVMPFPEVTNRLVVSGTPTVAPTFRGLTASALTYNGVDQYGEVAFTRRLNPPASQSFSWELWVRFTGMWTCV